MSAAATAIPTPGFADPGRETQRVFRAVLDALAHPGRTLPLHGAAEAPAALGPGLGAVALTLLDEDSTAWIGGAAGADPDVSAWLAFHTGTRRATSPADADFVLAQPADLPPLGTLRLGTEEAPHGSATVLLDVRGAAGERRFTAEGPGIDGTAAIAAPWADAAFLPAWQANHGLFPRGVDLVLVDTDTVQALPRTTRLTEGD